MIFKIIYTTQPEGCMEDARVHCVVLKVRAVPLPDMPQPRHQEKALEEQPPTTTSLFD